MSYVALYRAYRPQAFNEVSGQRVIIQTLQNALLHNKIAHAYIFSGPRGTGKTTVAKILAKAVNCLKQPAKEPCNECEVCIGIDKGDIGDVIEIDAASNNGVDEIRDLRDKVKYMPQVGKYKVYIIDEVHMLTTGAFNALLKTLEEPPKHIIFILATTEIHKVPLTILSRCQRFDFKNIEKEDIIEKLNEIIKKENIKIEDEAIDTIATNAEGGLRDAISLLDQAVSFSDGEITDEDIHLVSGSVSKKALVSLLNNINNKEVVKALETLKALISDGKDPQRITNDLILALRDILLAKGKFDNNKHYEDLSKTFSYEKIYYYLDTLNDLQQNMKWTHQKRAYLELALMKMMEHKEIEQLDLELLVNDLKQEIFELKQNKPKIIEKEKPKSNKRKPLVTIKEIEAILNEADREKKETLLVGWPYLRDYPNEDLKMAAYMLYQGELEAVSNTLLLVYDDPKMCMEVMNPEIKKMIMQILNRKTKFIDDVKAIIKSDWLVIKQIYTDMWEKGHLKPKLPQYDLKLYEEEINNKEAEIVSIAKSYFGDKVIIKE